MSKIISAAHHDRVPQEEVFNTSDSVWWCCGGSEGDLQEEAAASGERVKVPWDPVSNDGGPWLWW